MSRIIQIIAIVLIAGGLLYKAIPFIRKMKGAFKKIHVNSDMSLSDEKYRQLALGAIYSEQQSAFINSLTTGIPVFEMKAMLHNWWEVNDGFSAKYTLDFLLDNARKSVFPDVFKSFKNEEGTDAFSMFTDTQKKQKAYSQLQHLKDTFSDLQKEGIITNDEEFERLGTDGWELGRLVYVARMCFDAGFISETEAWNYIADAAGIAKEKFSNWKDFAYSYVIGRSLWSGKDSANSGIAYIAKYLLSEPQSPWVKLNW